MIVRILFIDPSPQGKGQRCNRAAVLGIIHLKLTSWAKECFQPGSRIGNADSHLRRGAVSRTIVPYAKHEIARGLARKHFDHARLALLRYSMPDGILNQ